MKALFIGMAGFIWALSAVAAPDCWTRDGAAIGQNAEGKEIHDGNFIVTVEAPAITKENLLVVMEKINFGNLSAEEFPQIFEETLIFHTKASSGSTSDQQVDRPKLIEQVGAQLDEIAGIPGVKGVDCNAIARPAYPY